MTIDTTGYATHALAAPVTPGVTRLTPLAITAAALDPTGFWGQRQALNADAIIEHCLYWMDRVRWTGNFDAAVEGRLPRDRGGREFADSDVYKLIEAMSWEVGRTGDAALDATIRSLVARIGRAQEPDGYLNTNFGRPGQAPRYSDLEWGHELYNYGHLLQAAVARTRASGRDKLFEIAERVADHVCAEFGVNARNGICGHPEIELGLVEFARLTGNDAYRDQAALFIERRGHGILADIEFGRSYFQDDMPVRYATVLRGHAVRALYLAAAAVDVAVDTADDDLLRAIELQWANTVARRTYLTGGTGSHHQDEAFGQDFELPNDRAYCETCAGVALVMLSWRLLLATGDPKYSDLIERALYNVVATSPAADGRSFFYTNTLHQRTPGDVPAVDEQSPRASSSLRAPWFDVSCCPPNVARTLASLGGYVATTTAGGIQLHQYATGVVRAEAPTGPAELAVSTRYPRDGEISVTVLDAVEGAPWTLELRVPAWASGATLRFRGETRVVEPGVASTTAVFAKGEEVVLSLPVQPRFTFPDQRIDADRGTVAVERGPEVYCLESTDLGGRHVDDFVVSTATPPREVDGRVEVDGVLETRGAQAWPFTGVPISSNAVDACRATLVPYHDWANRGPSTMRIWLRT